MSAGCMVKQKNTHNDGGRHDDMLNGSVYNLHYDDVFFLKAKTKNTFPKFSMYFTIQSLYNKINLFFYILLYSIWHYKSTIL